MKKFKGTNNTDSSVLYFFVFLLLFFVFLTRCSNLGSRYESHHERKKQEWQEIQHKHIVSQFTRKYRSYRGLQNYFQVWVTLLNSSVKESILNKEAYFMGWNDQNISEERLRISQEASTQSQVVISLFTPERSENNLDSRSSLWKVYLEVDGVRYLGEAKKSTKPYVKKKALFPHHSSFSVLYDIQFDVPMTKVEREFSSLILVSYLGKVRFSFPPLADSSDSMEF